MEHARQVSLDRRAGGLALDAAPISLLGMTDSPSSFRLKALGRNAAGRGTIRLE